MDFFHRAKMVRLKSYHLKYLLADDDGEHVWQDRQSTIGNARWEVEFLEDFDSVVRLKSCHGKYLTASEDQFILGLTGQKVIQSLPKKLDSSVEWEPVREGSQVRLKTRYGNYLRANGGLPPWRNSITHDIPHRHHDWILWEVEVVEIRPDSPPRTAVRAEEMDLDLNSSGFLLTTPNTGSSEGIRLLESASMKNQGRTIYYKVVDDEGDVIGGESSFPFKGHSLKDLTELLEEKTGLENIFVCSHNPLNGKLYPLRLALPPNKTTLQIVVVPTTSKAASEFLPTST